MKRQLLSLLALDLTHWRALCTCRYNLLATIEVLAFVLCAWRLFEWPSEEFKADASTVSTLLGTHSTAARTVNATHAKCRSLSLCLPSLATSITTGAFMIFFVSMWALQASYIAIGDYGW